MNRIWHFNNLHWLICHKSQPNQLIILFNINHLFVHLNGYKYSYQTAIILFKIKYLFYTV